MTRHSICRTILVLMMAAGPVAARSHHHRQTATVGAFDYYLLSLSYAPDFCDQAGGNKNTVECGSGRQTGFVVHGLWPQGENARGPQNCGSASPVSQELIRIMLNYYPTESLIRHEWADHGTCTGLAPADYFTLVRKARDSITIPADLRALQQQIRLDPHAVEAKFASANPKFPADAFRASCYQNAELQEARICFDKNLNPRSCSVSAGSCNQSVVTVLPVR